MGGFLFSVGLSVWVWGPPHTSFSFLQFPPPPECIGAPGLVDPP